MQEGKIHLIILIFWVIQGVMTNKLQLTPTFVYVKENTSASLTCSRTDGQSLAETLWDNSQLNGDANLYSLNGQCVTTRFLKDSDLFEGVCNRNGTYSVFLKRIDRTQHGAEWACLALFQTSETSNTVVIKVSVPATSVLLKYPNANYMKENHLEKITCTTSACRPDPRVQWYLRSSTTHIVYNLTQFSNSIYINKEHGLKTAESILNFKQNRSVNNLRLYCEVWTESDSADTRSKDLVVNITFPPDSSPLIQGFVTYKMLRVVESDTGTFVCSISGGNPVASLSWNCFGSNDVTSITEASTVKSTVKWTALRYHKTCSCTSHHRLSNWKRTTNVSVDVLYPPSKPSFEIGGMSVSGEVQLIENNTLRVSCKSESNPLPNYIWTGPDITRKVNTLEIRNVPRSNEGKYECKVSNRMTRTNTSYEDGMNSSTFSLTILYPTSNPKFRFQTSNGQLIQFSIFKVVKNDTFSIHCEADGNPTPNITWDNANDRSPLLSISSVTADKNRTCTATNVMKEIPSRIETKSMSKSSLSIIVLYPPGLPTIHVANNKGASVLVKEAKVNIIESETITITCFTESKPMPSYEWVYNNKRSTNVLEFVNIDRNQSGEYTCNVQNIMARSIGSTEIGKSTSKTLLNILYPGIVKVMKDKSISEGSQLEVDCQIDYGNPKNATIHWSRLNDESRWKGNKLFIRNVSRADDSDYTCSVITKLYPTIGNTEIIEKKNSFHLNVFFATEMKTFSVSTINSGGTVVVNETQNVPFECIVDANPFSNVTIKNPRGVIILKTLASNIANQTVLNVTYNDAGEYVCAGRNNYTRGYPADSKLTLIVRSPPRPSSGDTSVMKVATVMHADVTLHFIAWKYLDELNKTFFSWFKGILTRLDNNSKYVIHSNGLETNISIRNTTKEDLGLYTVHVRNSVGIYDHVYELRAADKPEPPSGFYVINNSITDTSVTLAWSPGFNGGFQQTFVLLFKMKHKSVWLNKKIIDNGDTVMNHTLSDLSSFQEYEIEMFAMNIQGNSANTGRLEFRTKASLNEKVIQQSKDDYSGIIGGSISALVIAVVVIAGAVFFLRKRELRASLCNDHQPDTTAKRHALSTSEGHVISEYTDLDSSKREINLYDDMTSPSVSTYEKLDTVKQVPITYMELKDTMSVDNDTSDYVNMRI